VEQLPASSPELAQELALVNAETRAGVDRGVALRNLGDRTGVEEIHGLVSLISHSTRLGSGIAGTLRIYADEFRDRRMQRAEELAATVGTKLLFPLILFMFPSFFVVAIGPAILGVMKAMAQS
jgi:tight adherence protein C